MLTRRSRSALSGSGTLPPRHDLPCLQPAQHSSASRYRHPSFIPVSSMAFHHHKYSNPRQRRYTVGYAPQNGKPNPAPAINLKGHWLAELGFLTGMPVTVTTQQGRLVIEVGSAG